LAYSAWPGGALNRGCFVRPQGQVGRQGGKKRHRGPTLTSRELPALPGLGVRTLQSGPSGLFFGFWGDSMGGGRWGPNHGPGRRIVANTTRKLFTAQRARELTVDTRGGWSTTPRGPPTHCGAGRGRCVGIGPRGTTKTAKFPASANAWGLGQGTGGDRWEFARAPPGAGPGGPYRRGVFADPKQNVGRPKRGTSGGGGPGATSVAGGGDPFPRGRRGG